MFIVKYELFKFKGLNDFIMVFTMSLQALASLAAKYSLTIQSTAEHLCHFLHENLNIDYIFDLSLARHICLIECGQELLEKNETKKPILSSTCPGFVCYAEKSQGSILVPLLSKIKSPQQIMGILVKKRFHLVDSEIEIFGTNLEQKIFHITLMPCYDKKLEASRFENKLSSNLAEVDCVITPIEIEKILQLKHIQNLTELPRRKLNKFKTNFNDTSTIYSHYGSGSGGYAENLFRIMEIQKNVLSKKSEPEWKIVKNVDFLELVIYDSNQAEYDNSEKKILLSFSIVNGFRNVQNLVSRLKRRTCAYNYIEVSACPKGCLNGGAQLRNLNLNSELNETSFPNIDAGLISYEQVQNLYNDLIKTKFSLNFNDSLNQELYRNLQLDEQFRQHFQTKFKALDKKFNILNSNW